jgi:hypothetical protein
MGFPRDERQDFYNSTMYSIIIFIRPRRRAATTIAFHPRRGVKFFFFRSSEEAEVPKVDLTHHTQHGLACHGFFIRSSPFRAQIYPIPTSSRRFVALAYTIVVFFCAFFLGTEALAFGCKAFGVWDIGMDRMGSWTKGPLCSFGIHAWGWSLLHPAFSLVLSMDG